MRILLYAINHAPEVIGIGKYMGELAEWLAARGHEVRVITAPPYYPAWRIAEGFSGVWYRREWRDGCLVYRCPLWVPEQATAQSRVLHLLSFALSSLPVALWQGLVWRPAVVFAVEPPFFCAPAAWAAARLGGAAAWLHVQDFELDVAFELGLVEGNAARTLVGWMERVVLSRFDVVSAISRRMCERLGEKGTARDRIALFENWVDTRAIRPLDGPSPMRAELAIDADAVVALYAGNMGEKQGLETLLTAAKALSARPDIRFVLAGDGAARARYEAMAEGQANVRFLGLQPDHGLNDLLNLADVHLLPQRTDAGDLVMPSKLMGMLGSGRPVIAGASPGTEIATTLERCGVVVPPDDGAAMAAAIESLAGEPARRRALGRAARETAVAAWDKEPVLARFAERLEAVAADRGNPSNPARHT